PGRPLRRICAAEAALHLAYGFDLGRAAGAASCWRDTGPRPFPSSPRGRSGRPDARGRGPRRGAAGTRRLERFIVSRKRRTALTLCLVTFSSREPVSTSLENALSPSKHYEAFML